MCAGKWQLVLANGNDMIRPFSVSCSAVLLSPGAGAPVAMFFGGEVDPSDKGHEGAGNFCDTVLVRAILESSREHADAVHQRFVA